MEDQTGSRKKKRGNSSKDKAASSIQSEPNFPSKSNHSGEDKGDETISEGEWTNDVEKLEMASCIGKSTVYTLTAKWCTKGTVDLEKMYSDLPNFIKEMKGQSCREDLE